MHGVTRKQSTTGSTSDLVVDECSGTISGRFCCRPWALVSETLVAPSMVLADTNDESCLEWAFGNTLESWHEADLAVEFGVTQLGPSWWLICMTLANSVDSLEFMSWKWFR